VVCLESVPEGFISTVGNRINQVWVHQDVINDFGASVVGSKFWFHAMHMSEGIY